jgi:HD-GYP domain-containing protein (c-di-GMP phosphodiesterase class II)
MSDLYTPISIESIDPALFPDVALYLKSGTNYVLYKSHGRDFSSVDAERLARGNVEFLHVQPSDMELITTYMESNAERFLKSDQHDNKAKGKMIYQTSINYVGDIFANPDKVGNLERSKRLIENLLLFMADNGEALASLESVMAHNFHTFVHSLQVTALSIMLHSSIYTVSRDEILDVGIGTLLHDIGKIFIPQEILNQTGKLSPTETALFKRHPEEGYRYLKEQASLSEVSLAIVRSHHERNNGNGYPQGLRSEQIPRSAQVAAVCDVYCTLTIDRTGKKCTPASLALQLMKQEMKGAFNERVLNGLEELVGEEAGGPPLL